MKIRDLRIKTGLTQQEACNLFDPPISRRTWEKWELGTRKPTALVENTVLDVLHAYISKKEMEREEIKMEYENNRLEEWNEYGDKPYKRNYFVYIRPRELDEHFYILCFSSKTKKRDFLKNMNLAAALNKWFGVYDNADLARIEVVDIKSNSSFLKDEYCLGFVDGDKAVEEE